MKLRLLALALLALARINAHECWLEPSNFSPAPGQPFHLRLRVGMDLQGEPRTFAAKRVAVLRHLSVHDGESLAPQDTTDLPLAFAASGGHLLAYDSTASLITLEPAKFEDYLREEGLDAIITERAHRGEGGVPGRERYLRCNKALLQVGDVRDGTWALRTGQVLELVPLADPASLHPGDALGLVLLLRGQPLAGTKVRAWHRAGDNLTTLDAVTTVAGEVTFTLPAAGRWMFSTVHMVRTADDPAADWESHWANLTLALPR